MENSKKLSFNIYRVYLGGKLEYKEDPFDNKREIEKKELKEHHSKMQEKPFSERVKLRGTFASHKEAFGEDRPYPNKPAPKEHAPLMQHDAPFKPSNPPKKGYNKTIDKFPPYKEDPLKFTVRKK